MWHQKFQVVSRTSQATADRSIWCSASCPSRGIQSWTLSVINLLQLSSIVDNTWHCHMTNYELLCWLVETRLCGVGHNPMLNTESATWYVDCWTLWVQHCKYGCTCNIEIRLFSLQKHSCTTLINEIVDWAVSINKRYVRTRVKVQTNSTAKVAKYKT